MEKLVVKRVNTNLSGRRLARSPCSLGEIDGTKADTQDRQILGLIEWIGLWADSLNKFLIVAMSKQLELEAESTHTNYIA